MSSAFSPQLHPVNPDSLTAPSSAAAIRRVRLLDAAQEILRAEGFRAVQIARIARRAGCATGLLYRHFTSRDELTALLALQVAADELALIGLMAEACRAPADSLAAAIRTFAGRQFAAPVLSYAMLAEPVDAALDTARLGFRTGFFELLAGLVGAGQQSGAFRDGDAALTAAAIGGAVIETVLCNLPPAPLRPDLPDRIATLCLRMVER